jgi:glycine dehydrogenase subunit 1
MSFVPGNSAERDALLREVGIRSFDDLLRAIPIHLRLAGDLQLPAARSEWEVLRYLSELSARNATSEQYDIYLGGGFYDHYSPAVVDFIVSRPEFATAYTPYQPEVSQGTLQSIYEFQTMVARLTGMDVVNASMYDGASATAEAVLLSLSHTKKHRVLCSSGVNPLYTEVIRTYTSGIKPDIVSIPDIDGVVDRGALKTLISDTTACVVVQSPNIFGLIENLAGLKDLLGNAILICVTNPLSLGILKPPGEFGVDICVGEAQPLGNAISYGGPGVGIFAAKGEYMRKLPGRLVARTKDLDNKTGYVLTLQTREQHIRREKATSNICTNQALCALTAGVYLSLLGKAGIVEVGELCVQNAHYLASEISKLPGFGLKYQGSFFNEFVVTTPIDAVSILKLLENKRILAGIPLEWFYPERKKELLIAVTEKRRRSDLDRFVAALAAEAA